MSAKAIWKGNIEVGGVDIPVKLYSAVKDSAVHFHLLHDEDLVRVKQKMVNPESGEAPGADAIQKGLQVEPGTFVIVTEAERRSLEPKATRDIRVHGFVPRGAIEPVWYDRPYYLGPDSKGAAYFALVQALRQKPRIGVVEWVMRGRTYYGALMAGEHHLLVVTLRTLDEIVPVPKVAPAARAADARELAMAEQLVKALTGSFDPSAFADEHRARVLEFVKAKARGKAIKPRRAAPTPKARPLTRALAASLEHVKKERKSA